MHDDYIGAGWAFPLRTNTRGGIALVRREQELEEAMRLILATYPGERPMRPEFGSRVRDWVFRGSDTESIAGLSLEVRTAILRWEPRVDVKDVRVTRDGAAGNKLLINIQYQALDTNDRRNLVFPFYTLPAEE
ncbi:MAG TPA: GPW/gp25 family protein [Acidimicrobiales bacterium]